MLAADDKTISMAHVAYDARREQAPFLMWFTMGEAGQPLEKEIRFAASHDGLDWTVGRTVMTPSRASGHVGVMVDFVCQDSQGNWNLFYTGFHSLNRASAYQSVASGPDGPFVDGTLLMSPDETRESILVDVLEAGAADLVVTTPGKFSVNEAVILYSESDQIVEVNSIKHTAGTSIELRRPTWHEFSAGSRIATIQRRKISPSLVYEEDNRWYGIFTGFGAYPGPLMEFTSHVRLGSDGWVLDETKESPAAWPVSNLNGLSLENPALLRSSAACSLAQP